MTILKLSSLVYSKYYYIDGTSDGGEHVHDKPLHRLDGPAIELKYDDGHTSDRYFIYDHFIGENLSKRKFKTLKDKKLKELIFS